MIAFRLHKNSECDRWMDEKDAAFKEASLSLIQLNIMPVLLLTSTHVLDQFCTHSDVSSSAMYWDGGS